jgi:hypothetical protein
MWDKVEIKGIETQVITKCIFFILKLVLKIINKIYEKKIILFSNLSPLTLTPRCSNLFSVLLNSKCESWKIIVKPNDVFELQVICFTRKTIIDWPNASHSVRFIYVKIFISAQTFHQLALQCVHVLNAIFSSYDDFYRFNFEKLTWNIGENLFLFFAFDGHWLEIQWKDS